MSKYKRKRLGKELNKQLLTIATYLLYTGILLSAAHPFIPCNISVEMHFYCSQFKMRKMSLRTNLVKFTMSQDLNPVSPLNKEITNIHMHRHTHPHIKNHMQTRGKALRVPDRVSISCCGLPWKLHFERKPRVLQFVSDSSRTLPS